MKKFFVSGIVTLVIAMIASMVLVVDKASAQRRGNVTSHYDPLAPRHGFNVVTSEIPQWRGWGGNGKRRTLNSGGTCDVNGCSINP